MKTIVVLVLSCASAFGADTGIKVVTTATTNTETASIYTKDIFTRDGQTNLVSSTKTKAGVVQIRIHRFYHAGLLVGEFMVMPDSSGLDTESGSPYSMSFEFGPSKDVKAAVIGTKDGVLLDAFTYTNGIFNPVENSFISKANSVGSVVRREIEELGGKHKEK